MNANNPMISETSICNQALLWLGQELITSLDDQNKTASWMKNNYSFIRDAVLETHAWTFATERATSNTADRDGWDKQFVHPIGEGWISILRCFTRQGKMPDRSFRVEGDKILSDYDTIWYWGIKRITDTQKFSPLFVQALAARLAADAAIPMTENRNLQSDMWNLFDVKVREAANRDGMQGANERVTSSSLVDVRHSGRGF